MHKDEMKAAVRESGDKVISKLGLYEKSNVVGIILGTGWGGQLPVKDRKSISFTDLPAFSRLGQLAGHKRQFFTGTVEGKTVFGIDGRTHLNESYMSSEMYDMVRLQTEIMLYAKVRKFIATCAAGYLPGSKFDVGSLITITDFFTMCAPDMPMFAGEFCSPASMLTARLRGLAKECGSAFGTKTGEGIYAMVRGPYFETLTDKRFLAQAGAQLVGMSMLPEACIMSAHSTEKDPVEMLGLAFVTNGFDEKHSHEANLAITQAASKNLGEFLSAVIKRM